MSFILKIISIIACLFVVEAYGYPLAGNKTASEFIKNRKPNKRAHKSISNQPTHIPTTKTDTSHAEKQEVPAESLPKITDLKIFDINPPSANEKNTDAYPGYTIEFTISNPDVFLSTKPNDQAKVVLYINGKEMQGFTTDWYSKTTSLQIKNKDFPKFKDKKAIIYIVLSRTPETQQNWNILYDNVDFNDMSIDIEQLSLGWQNMSAIDHEKLPTITIHFAKEVPFWIWVGAFIAILIIFSLLIFGTDILREGKNGPYSLSNTQLLFWTILVMGGFIYILLFSNILVSFNSSILMLMGISLSTSGVSAFIDSNKKSTANVVPKEHKKFYLDLLTDGNSYSIQRLQAVAWNLVLGLYFVTFVIDNKTMPQFSTTLLFLAGFSSTAYLTGKIPENTTPKTG